MRRSLSERQLFSFNFNAQRQYDLVMSIKPFLSFDTVCVMHTVSNHLNALYAEQALLYRLLDAAQSCRAGEHSKRLAGVGS